jgi:glutamate synthase (NADPH/NADH) large chain
MRKCHLNTCPVGVATQDPELRMRFAGNADQLVTFFQFLTQELREIMAELGFRTVNEMIGQTDCLEQKRNTTHWKHSHLDLSPVLYKEKNGEDAGLYQTENQDHGMTYILDWQLLAAAKPALTELKKVYAEFPLKNTDRTVGTVLSNEITKQFRAEGLPQDTVHFKFRGTAGQSFGAFNTKGVTLELEGDANDYFGKGLSGAKLVIYPDRTAQFVPSENSIIGNVAFYGATSGTANIRGKAGERFCVRNSGAQVVVEGVGDHGCEYMTGGKVVILGQVGRNFGAGMSGGIAYIWDTQKNFAEQCNMEMIDLDPIDESSAKELRAMLEQHFALTQSNIAEFILKDFDNQLVNFIKVFPKDYKKALLNVSNVMVTNG